MHSSGNSIPAIRWRNLLRLILSPLFVRIFGNTESAGIYTKPLRELTREIGCVWNTVAAGVKIPKVPV
jgi:hypothetical protein